MKKITPIALALALALGLAACSEDENLSGPADAIRIHTTVNNFAGPGGDTRAVIEEDGTGRFEGGDEISLCVVDEDFNPVSTDGTATYDGTGWTCSLSWADLGEPTTDAPRIFTAQFPPQTLDADGVFPFSVQTNQSTENSYKVSDLLVANNTLLKAKGDVNFEFLHVMARIKVVLAKGWAVTDDELSGATVAINNVYTQGRFYDDGLLKANTLAAVATVAPRKATTTAESATFYALLPPQPVAAGGLELAITIGGKTVTHRVQMIPNGTIDSGRQYTIELTLGNNTQNGITVTTWEKLKAALNTDGGTADNPAIITLGADISTPADAYETITIKGHKVIDGGNTYTLTRKNVSVHQDKTLFIDGNNPASLTVKNIALANESPNEFFSFTGEGSHLVLGPAVAITSVADGNRYIRIVGGARLTVDGATFTCTDDRGYFGSWISYSGHGYSGSTSGNITLKDYTFHDNDFISFHSPRNSLCITPGVAARLHFEGGTSSSDFVITSTGGAFTAADVAKVTITEKSMINGDDENGEEYEVYLDGDGKVRMRRR